MPERMLPSPTVTPENKTFWDSASQGKFMIKRCGGCKRPHYYPRTMCPHCGSMETHWEESSGRGEIYALSIMRTAEIPYSVGYVTLDEGVQVLTNFVDADMNTLRIGQPVKVTFRQSDGDVMVPLFCPS